MILSVDDGCSSDIRVAELARKYKIPVVFYWPVEWHSLAFDSGYEPLRLGDALRLAEEFEIGSHTITHRHLTKLPLDEAVYEIQESRTLLERIFEREVTRFAPPRGYISDELLEFANTLYSQVRLTKGKGLVHVHPNSGANNNKHWLDCIDKNTNELFCHSWELDKYNLWDELEGYLESLHSTAG